jgi:hypothetical protein
MSGGAYLATEAGEWFVVTIDGELVAHATRRVARDLARLLNVLEPTPEQVARLLGVDRGRLTLRMVAGLRSDAPCHRCGRTILTGSRAWWSPHTRLVRHVGRCPSPRSGSR